MAAVSPRRVTSCAAALALAVALGAGLPAHAAAHRVISIVPATTEMLFAMGAGDRLIAVGTYDHFPPEAARLPRVGALLDPNVERIISLRPDLVVVYDTQVELKSQLERASIPYFAYTHRGLADITATMRALGARVGVDANAAALATSFERRLDEIRARVANLPRPKTLLVFGRDARSLADLDASGGYGFLHDMLEAAGGADVLGDIHQQSVMMSTEMVLARAPEVIIELRIDGAAVDMSAWNSVPGVPAVRNHRVYLLAGEEYVVPGPRVPAATERLARILHPEAFR
jgi:iron complex transport system substrate-binding protein